VIACGRRWTSPDPTYKKLKSKAAAEGSSIKQLILRGVQKELNAGSPRRGRIKLPVVRSKHPGSLRLTSEQLYDAIPFP
jgi:hypothetical protein